MQIQDLSASVLLLLHSLLNEFLPVSASLAGPYLFRSAIQSDAIECAYSWIYLWKSWSWNHQQLSGMVELLYC